MGIYLAWSVYKLVLVVLAVLLAHFALWKLAPKLIPDGAAVSRLRLYVKWSAVIALCMVTLAAANIGDRQQSLTRSKFNATFPVETPAYVPPPPDTIKAARDALDKNILELNNSIKERKQ